MVWLPFVEKANPKLVERFPFVVILSFASKQARRHNVWTEITRNDYECRGGRYASDMTDREWALLAPFMSSRARIKGRKRHIVTDTFGLRGWYAGSWRLYPGSGRRTEHAQVHPPTLGALSRTHQTAPRKILLSNLKYSVRL